MMDMRDKGIYQSDTTLPDAPMIVALGLMSGTSRDGVDAALIRTDGLAAVEPVAFDFLPYSDGLRDCLADACRTAMGNDRPIADPAIDRCRAMVTHQHVLAARAVLAKAGLDAAEVGIVGFHGHTLAHRIDLGWTWQIGDPQMLADALGIGVVADMRRSDVKFGGQGAPLIPVYHRAIFADPAEPVAVLNLGGVANLTYLSPGGDLVAFDCGMANALIDDWMSGHSNRGFDEDGACAARGRVDEARLMRMLDDPFFAAPAPKSLDRGSFDLCHVSGMSLADGAATLTAFTARAVAFGLELLPARPRRLIVCGGGARNRTMLAMIAEYGGVEVATADDLGWDGDAIEAQGFAYLAYRCLNGLPITYPGTTGVAEPMSGGTLFTPAGISTRQVAA